MAGGQGWFAAADTPMTSEVLKLLAGGAYRHVASNKWKGLDISDATGEASAGRALSDLAAIPGVGFKDDNADEDPSVVADFGFIREFAKRASKFDVSTNTPQTSSGISSNHPDGPLAVSYSNVLDAYRRSATHFTQFLARTQPTVALPTSTELDDIIAKVTSNTSVWGSEGEWAWIEGLFGSNELLETIIASAVVSIASAEATPVAAAAVTASSASISGYSASTLSAPSLGAEYANPVDVDDLVDDAVSAFDSLDGIRYAQAMSDIQASFGGARAAMTSTLDDALVLAAAERAARAAAYDKDLRAAFVRDKAAAEESHRKLTIDQRDRQAQITVSSFQANEEAKARAASIAVQIGDIMARISMANQDAALRKSLADADAANRAALANAEMESRANIAGREIPAGIASGIMSSAVSWMHARAIPVTNAGAIASVIGTMYDAKLKNTVASNELSAKYFMDTFAGLASWAQGWNATGQAGWNSLTSNMELYRAAIATASGVPGTIHRDSTFNVATQAIAGGLGAVSGIANIAMALS